MKSVFPSRRELAIFVVVAIVAGALASLVGQRDTMLFLLSGPIFLMAALLGFRRSEAPQPVKESSETEQS